MATAFTLLLWPPLTAVSFRLGHKEMLLKTQGWAVNVLIHMQEVIFNDRIIKRTSKGSEGRKQNLFTYLQIFP